MTGSKRELIIDTAWKLFGEKGYAEATINDIIREAGISKGTFYYYFRSKDDLLDTLSEILDREYERLDREEPEGLSCFDRLMWLNYEVHSFMERNMDYRMLAYLYSAQIIKEDFSSLLNRNRYYYKYVERIMYEGQKSGELTDSMTVSEMVSFFSMGERALVTEWCMNNGRFAFGEYSRRMFPVMMQGLKNMDK